MEAGTSFVSARLIHAPSFDQPASHVEAPLPPATEQPTALPEAPLPAADSAAAGVAAPEPPASPSAVRVIQGVRVTFYACVGDGFCGKMYSGLTVHEGAAACSWDLPLGTRFRITGDPSRTIFVCLDRGHLSPTWVDIWRYDVADGWAWQNAVGSESDIEILE